MNKQKMILGLKDIELTLLNYFNKNNSMWLDILDGDSRKYVTNYKGYEIKGYSGVTIKYLREYLFDKKYSKSMITYVLLKLFLKSAVRSFYCCDIKHVVFESNESIHGSHFFIKDHSNNASCITTIYRYNSLIKSYNIINNYLNN